MDDEKKTLNLVVHRSFLSANRNAKQNLEIDWSNKWEASVADAKAANRRNEDVDIMFYPGVARHYDK